MVEQEARDLHEYIVKTLPFVDSLCCTRFWGDLLRAKIELESKFPLLRESQDQEKKV